MFQQIAAYFHATSVLNRLSKLSLLSVIILGGSLQALNAEDLPLGFLKLGSDPVVVEATFNSAHDLQPDAMVGIYGPGTVVKHPLTHQVETEYRKLIAKALVVRVTEKTLQAKIVYKVEGAVLEDGDDVVPMPGEASPDAPPVLTGEIKAITAVAQQTIHVRVPLIDPEGKSLGITWSLKGAYGHLGSLSAQSTGLPEINWTAPAAATQGSIVARAVDPSGQVLEVEVPFVVNALGDEFRQRSLAPYTRFGGRDGASYSELIQAADGQYWGIAADGRSIYTINPGWALPEKLAVADEVNLRQPKAIAMLEHELYVLDGSSIKVLAAGGQLQRQISGLERPTDLAVAKDGTLYVADQGAGGIQVFEKEGAFRSCLGRSGKGVDAFDGLTRICLDDQGTIYALDANQRQILRFDRSNRRLETWVIPGDPSVKLIDIAAHQLGLLILQSNGQVLIHTAHGLSGNALPSLTDSGLVERVSTPSSLCVDHTGLVLVNYPNDEIIARYDAQGKLFGVRGPSLWSYDALVGDAREWKYGLDKRSGFIYAHDNEGWRRYRFGGMQPDGPFERPSLMAVSPDGSALVVADERRLALERFNLKDNGRSKITFGQKGENNGQFKQISALCLDDAGCTYVADADNHRVSVFNQDGNFLYQFGHYERGKTASEIYRPELISVNAEGSACYIYDSRKYEIQKFELNKTAGTAAHITNGGGRGKAMGQVSRPVGLGCDRFGLLYLLDSGRRDLQVLDFRGNNMVGVLAQDMTNFGISSYDTLVFNPDGLPVIGGRGEFIGLRWQAK